MGRIERRDACGKVGAGGLYEGPLVGGREEWERGKSNTPRIESYND